MEYIGIFYLLKGDDKSLALRAQLQELDNKPRGMGSMR